MVLIYIYLIDLVQTLATLQFAERASRLVNVARANEILDDQAMLQKAHSEIARLKGRVNVLVRKLKAANSGMGSLDSQANKIQAFVVSLCILHAFAHYYIYSYTSTVCDHTCCSLAGGAACRARRDAVVQLAAAHYASRERDHDRSAARKTQTRWRRCTSATGWRRSYAARWWWWWWWYSRWGLAQPASTRRRGIAARCAPPTAEPRSRTE